MLQCTRSHHSSEQSMTIVVATGNQHKVAELETLFRRYHGPTVQLIPVTDITADFHPDEIGDTFEANAYIKAEEAYRLTGLPSIADDSGLEVNILNMQPGVISARYAGIHATDADNRQKLRVELEKHNLTQTDARFRCVLCYYDGFSFLFGEGICYGTVHTDEIGNAGFGYDPMFTPAGNTQRFAEMTSDEKSALSHRSLAVKSLLDGGRNSPETGCSPEPVSPDDIQVLVTVACFVALSRHTDLEILLQSVRHQVHVQEIIYEVILQSYLFCGFPATLEAMKILASERSVPTGGSEEGLSASNFKERGMKLLQHIYGKVAEPMLSNIEAMSAELKEWMIVEGYGKVLSRPGLDVSTRELCIVAQLAVLTHPNQLKSHLRGALRTGCTIQQINSVIEIIARFDEEGANLARRILRDLTSRARA